MFSNGLEWGEGLHKITQGTELNNEDSFYGILAHADIPHAAETGLSFKAVGMDTDSERISSYTSSVLAHI